MNVAKRIRDESRAWRRSAIIALGCLIFAAAASCTALSPEGTLLDSGASSVMGKAPARALYEGFSSAKSLHSGTWLWLGEDPTSWSIEQVGGNSYLRLEMTSDSGILCALNTNHNLLLLRKPIPDGSDFTAETMVIFDPQQNFQGAVLLAYQDDDNFVAVNRGFCDPAYGCVGDGVYFDEEADGCCFCIPGFRTAVPLFDAAGSIGVEVPVWLRITREGSVYSAYFSLNGRDWNLIGSHTGPNLTNVRIGITTYAGGTGNLGPIADFDYLSLIEY